MSPVTCFMHIALMFQRVFRPLAYSLLALLVTMTIAGPASSRPFSSDEEEGCSVENPCTQVVEPIVLSATRLAWGGGAFWWDIIGFDGSVIDDTDESCANSERLDNTLKLVGFEMAVLIGRPKAQCSQDWATCFQKCMDATGGSAPVNTVLSAVGMASTISQNHLDRTSLFTRQRLAILRACTAAGSWVGGPAAAYTVGTGAGCAAMCSVNRCHAQ